MANGLLDFIKTPEGQGLLSAAFGGLAGARRGTPLNNLGRAGLAGLGGYVDATDRVTQQDERAKMGQMRDLQLKQAQQQMADAEARRELAKRFSMTPGQMAVSQNGGPTNAAATATQNTAPGYNYQGYGRALASELGDINGALAIEQATKKAPRKLMSVAPGNVVLDEETGQPTFTAPNKPEGLPEGMRMGLTGPEWIPGYLDGRKKVAAAGASSVSVNTGQKGLDNTLKLRGDFRSEPIYKAHQEVQAAYSQITQSLKMASPAGDLAGATKFMKILDPGSVVRESELGMAMAASGLMDRVQNYASSIMNGTKLTPTQRKDFLALSDALFGESQAQYNAKRQEYEGIASRNGLNTMDVLGPASSVKPAVSVDDLVNKYRSK